MSLTINNNMELEKENLRKTADMMKDLMEAAGNDIFKPVNENTFKESLDRAVKHESDKKQDSKDS